MLDYCLVSNLIINWAYPLKFLKNPNEYHLWNPFYEITLIFGSQKNA